MLLGFRLDVLLLLNSLLLFFRLRGFESCKLLLERVVCEVLKILGVVITERVFIFTVFGLVGRFRFYQFVCLLTLVFWLFVLSELSF